MCWKKHLTNHSVQPVGFLKPPAAVEFTCDVGPTLDERMPLDSYHEVTRSTTVEVRPDWTSCVVAEAVRLFRVQCARTSNGRNFRPNRTRSSACARREIDVEGRGVERVLHTRCQRLDVFAD